MKRPQPMNAGAAFVQLLDEYTQVTGKEADHKVTMICKVSAERAMTQDWEWQKMTTQPGPPNLTGNNPIIPFSP